MISLSRSYSSVILVLEKVAYSSPSFPVHLSKIFHQPLVFLTILVSIELPPIYCFMLSFRSCFSFIWFEFSYDLMSFLCSVGVDFKIKTLTVGGKRLKLTIWDTGMYLYPCRCHVRYLIFVIVFNLFIFQNYYWCRRVTVANVLRVSVIHRFLLIHLWFDKNDWFNLSGILTYKIAMDPLQLGRKGSGL